ncbi:GNAT family N-acetyltransferase [Croceicoccus naphthovorans]|uniref:GNAT family N-acetyltransferase n=1 Tax=Croceicoccus naphthovorans TaxID=1348774 RepID=UPI001FE0BDE8|nr:GNAT family N-acetyltransferase [Croceicoccus naphthovorans]
MALTVTLADYSDPQDAAALIDLLDVYARDPMGGGAPLSDKARNELPTALAAHPGAFSLIARGEDGMAVGLANCFTGFSTFACAPLVNIHDLSVRPGQRDRGVGRALLRAVDAEAKKRGACKVTLEVLSGNERARALYASEGFAGFALDPAKGSAQFWEKAL